MHTWSPPVQPSHSDGPQRRLTQEGQLTVLGVREAKGLEFSDIAIVNYFTNS